MYVCTLKNTSLYRGFIAQNFFVIAIEHFCMKNFAIKRFFQGTQLNIRYIEFFVITKFVISKFHCSFNKYLKIKKKLNILNMNKMLTSSGHVLKLLDLNIYK